MVIKVIVQYNRGLLPDVILSTLCDYIIGEPFHYHEERLSIQPILTCLEGLDAFVVFLK